jgi:hypothetical protein
MFVGLGEPLLVALNTECGCLACDIEGLAGGLGPDAADVVAGPSGAGVGEGLVLTGVSTKYLYSWLSRGRRPRDPWACAV